MGHLGKLKIIYQNAHAPVPLMPDVCACPGVSQGIVLLRLLKAITLVFFFLFLTYTLQSNSIRLIYDAYTHNVHAPTKQQTEDECSSGARVLHSISLRVNLRHCFHPRPVLMLAKQKKTDINGFVLIAGVMHAMSEIPCCSFWAKHLITEMKTPKGTLGPAGSARQ